MRPDEPLRVRVSVTDDGEADGWRLAQAYGLWPPCADCGKGFGQGEVLLFRPRDRALRCGRCASKRGWAREEVVS